VIYFTPLFYIPTKEPWNPLDRRQGSQFFENMSRHRNKKNKGALFTPFTAMK
jgi:hypothetical protein